MNSDELLFAFSFYVVFSITLHYFLYCSVNDPKGLSVGRCAISLLNISSMNNEMKESPLINLYLYL